MLYEHRAIPRAIFEIINQIETATTKKTKIARIIARLNVGGPARHVVWLTQAFGGERYESVLIAGNVPEGEEDMAYFASAHGVSPVFIEHMSRELSVSDLIALFRIWRMLVYEKPDIVHTHTAKAGTLGRTAAFLYRWLSPGTLFGRPREVLVVHTFHGHIFHGYYGRLKTRIFLIIERVLARLATDKIVVLSKQQFNEINGSFGVGLPRQFAIVPLGLDLDALEVNNAAGERFRKKIGAGRNEFLIGIVGRLTEIKNHRLFIDAARRMAKDPEFSHVRFVIIGDGNMRKALEIRSEETGIIFAGNQEDTSEFYSALDVVTLTSLNEGTPLTLIEAMAFAKPWIASAVGGVTDLAGPQKRGSGSGAGLSENVQSHGKDVTGTFDIHERGIMFKSGDVAGLVAGIEKLVTDVELRRMLAASGRSFVIDNFSKSRLISDLETLYSLGSKPKSGKKEIAE